MVDMLTDVRRVTRRATGGVLTALIAALALVIAGFGQPRAQLFGDGSDGALVVSDTLDLTSDKNYTDLTVQASGMIETHGFTIRVNNQFINDGVIRDSYSGGNGGGGGTQGNPGNGYGPHNVPQPGGPGQTGLAGTVAGAGNGGRGGSGGGGGGGAWDATHTEAAAGGAGGIGGAGGKGGGVVHIYARYFTNNGTIHANGSNGVNGNPGQSGMYNAYVVIFTNRDMAGGGGGGGGGGVGGNGGTVHIVYGSLAGPTGTLTANGGGPGGPGGGGGGRSTNYSRDAAQNEELGGAGGVTPPIGGNGGQSEVDAGSSQGGAPGAPGQTGADGTVSLVPATFCYIDADNDLYGNLVGGVWNEGPCGIGYVVNNLDCDDNSPLINPGAFDIPGDGIDQDCSGADATCCVLRGDVNSDLSINVSDLTFLVAYLFNGGPPPLCADHADLDDGGSINVSDLTYLVAYLFSGGPAPIPC